MSKHSKSSPHIYILEKAINIFINSLMGLACCILLFLIIITCIDVIGRYFLNSPLLGSIELTEMGLALLVFTSLPIITYRQKHIVVDILDPYISPHIKFWISQISYLSIGFGFYHLAQYSEKLATRALRRGTLSEYLEIPQGYLMIFAQYSCYITIVLMGILVLQNFMSSHTKS